MRKYITISQTFSTLGLNKFSFYKDGHAFKRNIT